LNRHIERKYKNLEKTNDGFVRYVVNDHGVLQKAAPHHRTSVRRTSDVLTSTSLQCVDLPKSQQSQLLTAHEALHPVVSVASQAQPTVTAAPSSTSKYSHFYPADLSSS
jgi:hypothetical protein